MVPYILPNQRCTMRKTPVRKPKYGEKKKPRPRSKSDPHEYLPEEMTQNEELALALVLWKSLRCHGILTGTGSNASFGYPTEESLNASDEAIRLSKVIGCGPEFLALLFRLRLVRVTLTPME